jgi:hypothetical protein
MARTQRRKPFPPLRGSLDVAKRAIAHETEVADHALSAFAQARALAIRARQSKNAELASELDRFALSLVGAAEPVRVSYAQNRLGISNPTARSWIDRQILDQAGESPRRVSLMSLACAEEIVDELRRAGQERDLTAALERRLRWESWRQDPSFESELQRIRSRRRGKPRGHRTAELRSLAFHRRVANRLDGEMVRLAQERVAKWLRQETVVPTASAKEWQVLLSHPLRDIKSALVQDNERMRNLRQNTPFAGALPERERMRLVSETR